MYVCTYTYIYIYTHCKAEIESTFWGGGTEADINAQQKLKSNLSPCCYLFSSILCPSLSQAIARHRFCFSAIAEDFSKMADFHRPRRKSAFGNLGVFLACLQNVFSSKPENPIKIGVSQAYRHAEAFRRVRTDFLVLTVSGTGLRKTPKI